MGRLKSGLLVGGILGAGLMWLATTKKGREVRAQITAYAEEVYDDVKRRVMATDTWQTMSKANYVKIVEDAVDAYIARFPAAEHLKNLIVKLVAAQWSNLKSELKETESKKNTRSRTDKPTRVSRRQT